MIFFPLLMLFTLHNDLFLKVEPLREDVFTNKIWLDPIGTQGENEGAIHDWVVNPDTLSYDDAKTNIGELRKNLGERFRQGQISMEGIKNEFTTHLVDGLIPHWYGTPWSFGGHTAIPNQGKIACGYFISTTLRDMGLKLNRYKLAQKSPLDEAMALSCGSEIYSVEQEDHDMAFEEIDSLTQEGLYFIGFDTGHVGYLLKRKGELFLIHSNYLIPISVCIESLKDARVFKKFTKFHLVDISHNEILIQRWLNNTQVL
ncbi:hypothetical protein [Maribacter polysiphoniae]|uniref:hypothetical protein n=1 Tax=Maribacter polysiphoniae TaxID=429344 RepID=UPI00235440C0|nr:hypothetical protein [Maribacter polysiphoniae]